MRWLARLLLLRVLPRRLLPILTAWEVYQLIRGRRNQSDAASRAQLANPAPDDVPRLAPGPAARRPPVR